MANPPEASAKRFSKLARQLAKDEKSGSAFREGFGTGALFVGRKMYACLDESGALVLKLSPSRVTTLIESGIGVGWHPGAGKPLREYLAVEFRLEAKWLALAREAREYMRSKP
jgi:hypothetical protein